MVSELFFDNIFQCPVLKTEVGKYLFETLALVLRVFYLFNISRFHVTVFRLPAVVSRLRDTGLPADILKSSSSFN